MLGQHLGELVAGEVLVGDDPANGAGLFEDGEVPVHGALREPGLGEQLRQSSRASRNGAGRRRVARRCGV